MTMFVKRPKRISFCLLLDLDMFSTEEREAVRVKEGQGVVLLCAPPPHSPG